MSALRPWVIRTEPGDSELLSSYLVRTAHAHGMNPYRFCSFHFPRVCIWNRDIDRMASADFLSQVSRLSSLAAERTNDLTLSQWRQVIRGSSPKPGSYSGTDPWINSIGILHRLRHKFGLQYCPECLEAEGYFKKEWRLSVVTTCPRHGCSLSDCCGRCQAPVCFHRNDALLTGCWQCGYPLAQYAGRHDADLGQRLEAQQFFMTALYDGSLTIGAATISCSDFFGGLSLLLRTIKFKLAHSDQTTLYPIGLCAGFRIEHERLVARAERSLAIFRLLDCWPERLLELAADLRLNQSSFAKNEAVPEWLTSTLALLPPGGRRTRSRKTAMVRRSLRRVVRDKKAGWRASRARVLLAAAGASA